MADTLPSVGSPAPEFTAEANNGETISLSDYRGKKLVVLYFYPRADTPGCTMEACSFRDNIESLNEADTVVLGVSPDTVKKQAKFADKFKLPFALLADPEHQIAEAYGVWKEKSFMGRKFMGVERSTFLIDKEGVLRHIFPKVKVAGHTKEVLAALEEIRG